MRNKCLFGEVDFRLLEELINNKGTRYGSEFVRNIEKKYNEKLSYRLAAERFNVLSDLGLVTFSKERRIKIIKSTKKGSEFFEDFKKIYKK